jgi:hypothetical protein
VQAPSVLPAQVDRRLAGTHLLEAENTLESTVHGLIRL